MTLICDVQIENVITLYNLQLHFIFNDTNYVLVVESYRLLTEIHIIVYMNYHD